MPRSLSAATVRVALLSLAVSAMWAAAPQSQQNTTAYTVFMPDGKRMTLPFRAAGGADLVSLDQLAAAFGLTVAEDNVVGGLTIRGRGQTVLMIPGQSMASIGPGRIVSLPAPLQRSGNTWLVPVDFVRIALGPALGVRTEVRRPTHVIVVGDARVPEAEVAAGPAPPAPTPAPTPAPSPAPSPAPALPKPVPTDPPVLELPPPAGAGVRTIVIDPGHGGPDNGVTGPRGTREKDYVLDLARRLKTAIESRLGLRVLLTRDQDELVPVDRRTSLANNNKADLFVSLHANASKHSDTSGAQVLTLNASQYQMRLGPVQAPELPVPVVSGGSRSIDLVPWDVAQLPFADASARVASVLVRRLADRKVPLFTIPAAKLPLRPLVGANMPAVLVEVGFLSSARDETALTTTGLSASIVDAIVDTVAEVRRDGSSNPAGGVE